VTPREEKNLSLSRLSNEASGETVRPVLRVRRADVASGLLRSGAGWVSWVAALIFGRCGSPRRRLAAGPAHCG